MVKGKLLSDLIQYVIILVITRHFGILPLEVSRDTFAVLLCLYTKKCGLQILKVNKFIENINLI